MKTLTIRGIDEKLSKEIKKQVALLHTSINQWALDLLMNATGLDREPVFKEYHDLDQFAGTWTEDDVKEFQKNTGDFNIIDQDLWK